MSKPTYQKRLTNCAHNVNKVNCTDCNIDCSDAVVVDNCIKTSMYVAYSILQVTTLERDGAWLSLNNVIVDQISRTLLTTLDRHGPCVTSSGYIPHKGANP